LRLKEFSHLSPFSEKPGAPDAPKVSEIFRDSCLVTWSLPNFDGGAKITGYHLERRLTSATRWSKVNKELIKDLFYKVTDLKHESEYEFRVSAENKAGVGSPSPPSRTIAAKDPWGEFTVFVLIALIMYLMNSTHSTPSTPF
jgi:titin